MCPCLRIRTPRGQYRQRFTEALGRVRQAFQPDFVVISSGFDVLAGDPLGGQRFEPGDLHAMTGEVAELLGGIAVGRLVAALEGGSVPEQVGLGTVAVVRALCGLGWPPEWLVPVTPEDSA